MAISLNLADGRRYFWQWDTEQYLIAQELPIGAEIHFDMPECNIPLKTLIELRGDKYVCRVPDELLQHSGSFTIWAYVVDNTIGDAIGNRTVYTKSFDVQKREKPPGYVYTATELVNFENLNRRLTEVEDALDNFGDVGNQGDFDERLSKVEETLNNLGDLEIESKGAVRYDQAQDLADTEKEQARANIGIEEFIMDSLITLNIAPVLMEEDGTVLADDDGAILLNM